MKIVNLELHDDDYELVKEIADDADLPIEQAASRIFKGMLSTMTNARKIQLAKQQAESTSH